MVDHLSRDPLSEQVAAILRGRIARGELRPGDRVPSENDLTREHRISRGTARVALEILRQEGRVVRLRGRGTFVAPSSAEPAGSGSDERWRTNPFRPPA